MPRHSWASALLIGIAFSVLPVASSDFYEWTDENGVTHFASSLDEVPAKYRGQAKAPKAPATSKAAPASASKPAPATTEVGGGPSARLEIPYQAFEGSARRVIIPVTLNDTVTAKMALDTGAPGMVISVALAQRLGLFSRDGGTLPVGAAGIGGTEVGILTIVDSVSLAGARSVFVPTTVTTRTLSTEFDGLIGMDFLANYSARIDSKNHVVVFEENPCGAECRGGHDESWWRSTFRAFRDERDRWQTRAKAVDGGISDARGFTAFQVRESERLLQRLDAYASDNAVPRHWR